MDYGSVLSDRPHSIDHPPLPSPVLAEYGTCMYFHVPTYLLQVSPTLSIYSVEVHIDSIVQSMFWYSLRFDRETGLKQRPQTGRLKAGDCWLDAGWTLAGWLALWLRLLRRDCQSSRLMTD